MEIIVKRVQMGKIYQKFMILEILPFAFFRFECLIFFHRLSKGGRIFLKDNYKVINNK